MTRQVLGRCWMVLMGIALVLMTGVAPASAQQMLLDKQVKAGELVLFPDLNNENLFYYVADKVRIATDASGTPQFSFLRYVENVRSGADQAEAREGDGGGIVHALVTLGVSPEQLADARRELARIKPGAQIQGPALFKAGRFGLVSSFADPKGNLTKQVVGLGNAPLLDGEKAAISIQLTKLGAKILWESFNTAAPDVSFHFEMDISGFMSPKRAVIEADWSKVYSHKAFGVGVATTVLAAEVKGAFDELRTTDAIKITQVGSDDKMDAIIATAYELIKQRMFEPAGGTGTPSLDQMGSIGGSQPSLLDRATTRLKEAQTATEAENARIRAENKDATAVNDKARGEQAKAAGAWSRSEHAAVVAGNAEADAAGARRRADLAAKRVEEIRRTPRPTPVVADAKPTTTTPDTLQANNDGAVVNKAGAISKTGGGDASLVTTGEGIVPLPSLEDAQREAEALKRTAEKAEAEAKRLRAEADKADTGAVEASAAAAPTRSLKEEKAAPTLSIVASLEMKKVKQSGTFRMDLNKFTPENMTLSFSENIGDLRRLKGDNSHFREVNLDDPLFKQRELVAMVDGVNAQDFGQFINFADVQMRKKHSGGEETTDEVRVDRNNFNKEGNAFKLLYGWKNDNDRSKWMEYEVQTTWNFFGGKSLVEPWRKANSGTIALVPPFRRRTVMTDGSTESLQQADVRAVTVKFWYDLAGTEQSKQVTLNVSKGQIAEKVEMLTPPNVQDYAFEINWQLKGNRMLTSPRQKGISDVVYVDELPAR